MFKKDYLIKQLEEFGKVLSLLLTYKKEQDYEKFEKDISMALKKFADQNLNELEDMAREDFQNKMIQSHTLDLTQKKIILSVLFEKMNYYRETAQEERADDLKNKCLFLCEHIHINSTVNEYDLDIHYKLNYLRK